MRNQTLLLSCSVLAVGITLMAGVASASEPVPISVIPSVDAAAAKANLGSAPPPSNAPARKKQDLNRNVLTMRPGVNEMVNIAMTHLNRLVTPFERPQVRTVSAATTDIVDNVVYVGTNDTQPVTLFITETGSEDQALSITLIPQRIPPRDITLQLAGATTVQAGRSPKAEKWEQSQPYIASIEKLLKTLALGELPSGYKFIKSPVGQLPACRQSGLSFEFAKGQTVQGNNLNVHIGVMKNTDSKPIEFIEDTCGDWDVAAVAAFPNNVIEPGQKSEVYVVVKRNYREEVAVKRPSLLGETP